MSVEQTSGLFHAVATASRLAFAIDISGSMSKSCTGTVCAVFLHFMLHRELALSCIVIPIVSNRLSRPDTHWAVGFVGVLQDIVQVATLASGSDGELSPSGAESDLVAI